MLTLISIIYENTKHKTQNNLSLVIYTLLLFLTFQTAKSQISTNLLLSWDKNVGCQIVSKTNVRTEEIEPSTLIRVCEKSRVRYTLSGNLTGATVQWSAIGGNTSVTVGTNTSTSNSAIVLWGTVGTGSVTFTVTFLDGSFYTKTLNIELIRNPLASFNIIPQTPNKLGIMYSCLNQVLTFNNLSLTNGGSNIDSYYWTFGDGTPFSTVQNPQHAYTIPGSYLVTLEVTNECGCKSIMTKTVNVSNEIGLDLSCASVVCDGATSTYSLTPNSCTSYDFSVIGGTIINNSNTGNVTVAWNAVGPSGFGYITFTPNTSCNLTCLTPTTLNIPVIQNVGTIQGNASMCINKQEIYKLPQWPSTDFTWTVDGNSSGLLAVVTPTDQRNEIAITPLVIGPIVLRCTYQNTLLHCGGTATFTINVGNTVQINGPDNLCVNNSGAYQTNSGQLVNWTLTSGIITIATLANSASFNYNFTTFGNYALQIAGTNYCSPLIKNIKVSLIPAAVLTTNLNQPVNICKGFPVTYNIIAPNPNLEYIWVITGGTTTSPLTGNSINITFNSTGPYNVEVRQKIIGQLNCTSPALLLTPNFFVPLIDVSDSTSAQNAYMNSCSSNEKTYYSVNQGVSAGLYTQGDSYSWSISPSYLGSVVLGQNTNTVKVLWNSVNAATNAQLILTIIKCATSFIVDKTIVLNPPPILQLSNPAVACSGTPVNFVLSTTNGVAFSPGTIINWNLGNGTIDTTTIGATPVNSVTYTDYFYTNPLDPTYLTSNIGFTINASIVNPNGCLITVSTTSTIAISPGPTATISAQNGNIFCIPNPITTILTAVSSTGATIKWYEYPNQVGTGNVYNVTTPGFYYFIATAPNGCASQSDDFQVILTSCGQLPLCPLNPYPVVNINQTFNAQNNCAALSLVTSTSPTPIISLGSTWSIFGPDSSANVNLVAGSTFYNYNTTINSAGIYHIEYNCRYTCSNGNIGLVQTKKDITVPYVPIILTNVACGTANSYNITLRSNTSFMPSVTNRHYYFSWSHFAAGPWVTIPNPTNSQLIVFNTAGAGYGNFYFKLGTDGQLPPNTSLSPICETTSSVINILSPPINQTIIVQSNFCYDSAIGFKLSSFVSTDTYLWNLEQTPQGLAQNTVREPSRVFDPLPNFGAQTKTVTVRIWDQFGCERTTATTPLSVTFTIPARCFYGNLTSTSPATCAGAGNLVLTYVPDPTRPNLCVAGTQFLWFRNNTPIANTTTGSFTVLNVTGYNQYSLKLKNGNCIYECPTRIVPSYLPQPTLRVIAPAIVCKGSSSSATVSTNGVAIKWYVDGVLQVNTTANLPLDLFALGSHTLTATVTGGNGCQQASTIQTFLVKNPALPPTVSYTIDCSNYAVTLTAVPPAGGTGVITWSSGTIGNPTTVYSGGPYLATYNDGSGCLVTAQVIVPQSLDKYLWIFPKGCYAACDNNLGTLIGPSPEANIPNWAWRKDGNVVTSGLNTVLPYQPATSGTYTMSLTNNASPTACVQRSDALDLTITNCEACTIRANPSYETSICKNNNGLRYWNFSVIFNNTGTSIINAIVTVPNNQVLVVPSAIVLNSGNNFRTFTVYQLGGFSGGVVNIILNGTDASGKKCTFSFNPIFPICATPRPSAKESLKTDKNFNNSLTIAPNPARDHVTIRYNDLDQNSTIALYDLTGRLINEKLIDNAVGEWQVNTSQYQKGIYIVVVKNNDQNVWQQKLIIE